MGGGGERPRTEFENGRSESRWIDGVTRSSSRRRPILFRITHACDRAVAVSDGETGVGENKRRVCDDITMIILFKTAAYNNNGIYVLNILIQYLLRL